VLSLRKEFGCGYAALGNRTYTKPFVLSRISATKQYVGRKPSFPPTLRPRVFVSSDFSGLNMEDTKGAGHGGCLAGVRLLKHAEKRGADTLGRPSRNLIVKCVISLSATSTFPAWMLLTKKRNPEPWT
jgi:hypothetical protein